MTQFLVQWDLGILVQWEMWGRVSTSPPKPISAYAHAMLICLYGLIFVVLFFPIGSQSLRV